MNFMDYVDVHVHLYVNVYVHVHVAVAIDVPAKMTSRDTLQSQGLGGFVARMREGFVRVPLACNYYTGK